MGGNIGGGHDARFVDLVVIVVLLAVSVTAWTYFSGSPQIPTTTAFIVPSQTTHW